MMQSMNESELMETTVPSSFHHAADVDGQHKMALHHAARSGDEARVRALLDAQASVDALDRLGWTPLHHAAHAHAENVAVASLLLDAKANINARNHEGETPLYQAVRSYKEQLVHFLIDAQAEIAVQNTSGNTPLHCATCLKHVRLATLLLESGANVNAANQQGLTPLHEAARRQHQYLLQLLLDRGANPQLMDNQGRLPLLCLPDEAPQPLREWLTVQTLAYKPLEHQHPPPAATLESGPPLVNRAQHPLKG